MFAKELIYSIGIFSGISTTSIYVFGIPDISNWNKNIEGIVKDLDIYGEDSFLYPELDAYLETQIKRLIEENSTMSAHISPRSYSSRVVPIPTDYGNKVMVTLDYVLSTLEKLMKEKKCEFKFKKSNEESYSSISDRRWGTYDRHQILSSILKNKSNCNNSASSMTQKNLSI